MFYTRMESVRKRTDMSRRERFGLRLSIWSKIEKEKHKTRSRTKRID
jgi:hypothetical protein